MMMCVILADLIYMLFFWEKFATLCKVVQRGTKEKVSACFALAFLHGVILNGKRKYKEDKKYRIL